MITEYANKQQAQAAVKGPDEFVFAKGGGWAVFSPKAAKKTATEEDVKPAPKRTVKTKAA